MKKLYETCSTFNETLLIDTVPSFRAIFYKKIINFKIMVPVD